MLESDLPTAAQFMYTSQLQQATNRFVFLDWPNEPAQLALYEAIMRMYFQDPDKNTMYKVTDTKTGEMIASLILTRNVTPAHQQENQHQEPAIQLPTTGMNPAVRPTTRKAMMEVQEYMKGVDHIAISTIFVKPEYRNKNIGAMLVREGMKQAAAVGLPLFLCSVPSAVGFYRKLGFKDTSHADIDLAQWGPERAGFGVYRLQGMLATSTSGDGR